MKQWNSWSEAGSGWQTVSGHLSGLGGSAVSLQAQSGVLWGWEWTGAHADLKLCFSVMKLHWQPSCSLMVSLLT